ncbi:hypothetical protein J31TS4_32890 [Paenibacillus sp. J31TS4]|uniref:hypothetical protein n=1 Tax=Paenibacillus sp. J31TS4 TaxID=2807195 RepID=UPI001B0CC2CC|nr:hypothetical protein [Paenibacillus sp. J31TS4]GIP40009.1 hypothetical protein J31TS4_32890 [Paenibacillus sp. J31TS4]
MAEEQRRRRIIFLYLGGWLLGGMAATLLLLAMSPAGDWHGLGLVQLRDTGLFGLSGALGGTIYALRNLHRFFDGTTGLRWTYWYLSRPWLCACTAVFLILLLDSGLFLLKLSDSLEGKMGLSFLTGLGSGKLMEKLSKLSRALFGEADRSGEAAPRDSVSVSNRTAGQLAVPADPGPAPAFPGDGPPAGTASPAGARPSAAALPPGGTPADPGPAPAFPGAGPASGTEPLADASPSAGSTPPLGRPAAPGSIPPVDPATGETN